MPTGITFAEVPCFHIMIIQNQFFISSLADDGVKNKFAEALRERISRAHARNKKFRVIIMMPLFPNFEGA
jgi:phospholipase D1/2